MPRDMTSGTPSFRTRLQEFADANAGDPALPEPQDLGARAYRPDPSMFLNPGMAEQEFSAAPGGRTDIGSRFLYETQRAGVAPTMELFQKFMQTGSIR